MTYVESAAQIEHRILGWKIIEWKVAYYRPEAVHPTRASDYEISDADYDAAERRYLTLCSDLDMRNTVVHKHYPGFDDVDYTGAMFEIDDRRPSVQLVLNKLGSRKVLKMSAPLEEDADERRMFDDIAKTVGGNLKLIATTLRVWARTLPQEGSMAKQCTIMANEIAKVNPHANGKTSRRRST